MLAVATVAEVDEPVPAWADQLSSDVVVALVAVDAVVAAEVAEVAVEVVPMALWRRGRR
ncbi:MAG: hypothetical protein R2746_17110 [Acidimicrobiales bacterium]